MSEQGVLTRGAATRVGTVGVYTSGHNLDLVRRARALAGRVTVAGVAGRKAICTMDLAEDLHDVDYDPASYLLRDAEPEQLELVPLDLEEWQRSRRLATVRSCGSYVRAKNRGQLSEAFSVKVGAGVMRVVSFDGWWLRDGLRELLARVRHCDNDLALVLAAAFDPLDLPGAVDGLRTLLDAALVGGRRVELLRSDVTAVGFAAAGGAHGALGTNTSMRHHGLPIPPKVRDAYEERQRVQYIFVPALLSWHKGTDLGALSRFDGAGIGRCSCPTCDGQSLLRFDKTWLKQVPAETRREAQMHDLHTCVDLASRVLTSPTPSAAWESECAAAVATSARILRDHKVLLKIPKSISGWI